MTDAAADGGAVEAAREAALRLLERQARSRRDLARRLRQRGFPAAAIEAALERLAAARVLDDRAYAEGFVRRRLRLRPRAPALLRHELRSRGVPDPVIEEVLGQAEGALDELALARAALRRSRYRLDGLDPEARRRRGAATLRRLGFSAGVISGAIAELACAEPADAESRPDAE